MKKVIILGSTGIIGRNTIEVIRGLKGFEIVGLAAYRNLPRLTEQARRLESRYAVILEPTADRTRVLKTSKTSLLFGETGLLMMVEKSRADIMVFSLASAIGVSALLKGIEKRMRICLATKEILVSFGEIVMRRVQKYRGELFPIDSEHSAIFQCLRGESNAAIRRVFLTASGGPFLRKNLRNAGKADVLNHPVWKMGQKITVDSATMMNKGLEVIEAHHLFGLRPDQIKVVIHPEAICHSLVQFIDGSIKAQFSYPDMKLPIQYALTAPDRQSGQVRHIDMTHFQNLQFLEPDFNKFPALNLAYCALEIGKSMPAVLNGANAEAVNLFLEDKVKFVDIPEIIAKTMKSHLPRSGGIDDYFAAEKWAHEYVRNMIVKNNVGENSCCS